MTGIERDTPVMLTVKQGSRAPFIIHPLILSVAAKPAPPDRALEWTDKLVAKIKGMTTRQEAEGALSLETVTTRLAQLSTSRPELKAKIDAAVAALPSVPTTTEEPPAVSVATLIKRLNACKDADAAGVVMTDPDVDELTAEDAGKLMAAYRAKFGDA